MHNKLIILFLILITFSINSMQENKVDDFRLYSLKPQTFYWWHSTQIIDEGPYLSCEDERKMVEIEKILFEQIMQCHINNNDNLDQYYSDSKYQQYFLIYAVRWGLFDTTKKLLEHKANPDVISTYLYLKCTPLNIALKNNDNKMLKLLLQYQANPNTKTHDNLLTLAIDRINIGALKLLLKYGANQNLRQHEYDYSPLIQTVLKNDFYYPKTKKKIVELLLSFDVDINLTWYGNTAEEYAQRNNFHDFANTIKNYYPSKKELFETVQKKEKEITEQDVEKVKQLATKVTFKIKDEKGNTPLHYCIANRHQRLTEICLQVLPKLIKMKNKNGETPLHLAAINNQKFLNFIFVQ